MDPASPTPGRLTGDALVVRGLLAPLDWDDHGEPRRVAVLTSDEGEVEIELDESGRRLLAHLREVVEVRGTVGRGPAGAAVVRVSTFRVIPVGVL